MLRFPWQTFALLLVALAGAASRAKDPVERPAVPVDGESFSARLTGISADWSLQFGSAGAPRTLAAIELAHWGTQIDRDDGPVVLLADGGRLIARVTSLTGDRLNVDSQVWGAVSLPLELVRGVVFKSSASAAERDRLERQVLEAAGDQDLVLLANGDRAEGILSGPPGGSQAGDPQAGGSQAGGPQPGAATFDRLALNVKGEELSIPLEDVLAVVFNPALAAAPRVAGMHAMLGFDDGSLLVATEVREKNRLTTLTLPGGVPLTTDSQTMWEETVYVRPATPRVVYLSDLRPIGFKHVPFLALDWGYNNDRNVLGGKLRAGEHVYDKGLGMHSASRLAYELAGEFERFEAELAIDARAALRGSVICRVYLDRGDGNWQSAVSSPVIRGGEAPVPISLEVRGVRRLALIVEFADRGDECDYIDLLRARLIR